MKKLFLLIIPILLLCGCSKYKTTYTILHTIEKNLSEEMEKISSEQNVYVDEKTCVEYFRYKESTNYGVELVPRYNQDGTLSVNEECLKNK